MPSGPIVREPTPQEDRIRPVPLVGVALGSLAAGFLVVWALGHSAAEGPGAPDRARLQAPRKARPRAARLVSPAPEEPPAAEAPGPAATGAPGPPEPAAPASPEPASSGAPAPAGVTLGQAFYFRCWEAGHDDPVEGECDELPALEERVREQLGEIATCASGSSGTLSIGLEVQFASRRTRWWSGRSTTITPVEPLIQCVRARLADTNVEGIEHRYQKYTLFLPVQLP
ncbi:MAG: hypothetical protein HYY06_25680 [Deltaproteobacteria bacterium]|nr:hypothetical protein [Deltaproteobacteria bacterium]